MRTRWRWSSASVVATLVAAALLVGACTPVVPAGPPPNYIHANTDQFAEYVIASKMQDTRRWVGTHTLRPHGVLTGKARYWSKRMAEGACAPKTICHSKLTDRIHGHVASWSLIGENVGVGGQLQALWDAFIRSGPHVRNITDGRWHYYGIGVIRQGNTIWVTMVFMRM